MCNAAELLSVDFFAEFWTEPKPELDGIKRYRRADRTYEDIADPAAELQFGYANSLSKQSDDQA